MLLQTRKWRSRNPLRVSVERGGRGGTRIVAYARITYVIAVNVTTHVDLTVGRASRALMTPCLDPNDVEVSQEVGEFLPRHGVQGIVFPSAIPGLIGRNLVVFREATPPPAVVLVNREEVLTELRRLANRLSQ